jgi:hypothetical protein
VPDTIRPMVDDTNPEIAAVQLDMLRRAVDAFADVR